MSGKPTKNRPLVVYRLSPARAALVLTLIVVALAVAYMASHYAKFHLHVGAADTLHRFFDFGTEANLPSFVSSLNLLLAGILTLAVAAGERAQGGRCVRHWQILGMALILMSVDELAQIHEGVVGALMIEVFGRGEGVLYYSWYKFYIPVVIVFGVYFAPFLRQLPKRTALLFAAAGAGFVASAIGVEMLESYLLSAGLRGRGYTILVEETGEMMSVVLFIYAVMDYMANRRFAVRGEFLPTGAPGPAGLAAPVHAEDDDRRVLLRRSGDH